MVYLIAVTLIWAFSFSLIGVYLAGQVDGYIAVASRMLLALVVFLPFTRFNNTSLPSAIKLMSIGAIQIGVMYLLFYHAFLYLSVAEVLLFTIFTPIYVTLFDAWIQKRAAGWKWVLPAILSVVGAAIIRYDSISGSFIKGFLLIQGANICFAFGQVAYKRAQLGGRASQLKHFFFFFLGASIVTCIAAALFANWQKMPSTMIHYGVLLWLGVIASGLGYFLWNYGAKKSNTGQLATMNNALIPAGLVVNFSLWGQSVNWITFGIGGAIILLAVLICRR